MFFHWTYRGDGSAVSRKWYLVCRVSYLWGTTHHGADPRSPAVSLAPSAEDAAIQGRATLDSPRASVGIGEKVIPKNVYSAVNELLCENHALYDCVILVFFWQTQTRTIMRKSGVEALYYILALQADGVEIMEDI